jgi:hypothetical protein
MELSLEGEGTYFILGIPVRALESRPSRAFSRVSMASVPVPDSGTNSIASTYSSLEEARRARDVIRLQIGRALAIYEVTVRRVEFREL